MRTVHCDLMSRAAVARAAEQVNSLLGREGLDVLALNAGVMALNDVRTGRRIQKDPKVRWTRL